MVEIKQAQKFTAEWAAEPKEDVPFFIKHAINLLFGSALISVMLMHFHFSWILGFIAAVIVIVVGLLYQLAHYVDSQAAHKLAQKEVKIRASDLERGNHILDAAAEETMTSADQWTGNIQIVGLAMYEPGCKMCRFHVELYFRGVLICRMINAYTKNYAHFDMSMWSVSWTKKAVSENAIHVLRELRKNRTKTVKKQEDKSAPELPDVPEIGKSE